MKGDAVGAVPLHAGDPRQLGGYWLAGRLGAGAQGVVYEAYGRGRHPGGVAATPPYIVSEFVGGPDLQKAVEDGGPLDPVELHRLAIGMATALAAIHHGGVVHRDLKPAKVLLGPDGPRVIDFGVARTELPACRPLAGVPGC